MRKLALIALLAAMLMSLGAQRVSAQRMAPAPHFAPRGRTSHFGSFAYPLPLFSDSLYSDALFRSGYPVASQPTVIVMQPPSPAESAPARFPAPAQPLLIELQGDRYVRVSGEENSGAEMIDRIPANHPSDAPNSATPIPTASTRTTSMRELAPAVLVFRDVHREELSDYTIADGVLYTAGNYYVDGSWNRKIELSSLSLSETIEANRSRGVRFQLPTAPNEVIVRP
jgi:hypothetical protein